jgi:hypothetical protein
MFALLMAEFFDVPPIDEHISSAQCHDDLPAFIDLEMTNSTHAAIAAYPHVWWQLWVDPDFAEAYRLTISMIRAERRGEIPALTLPPLSTYHPRLRLMAQINLGRAFFSRALSEQTLLGSAYGADTDEPFLMEPEESACSISLSVRKKPGEVPTLTIAVAPPINGRVVLMYGATVLEAPFDAHGVAVLKLLSTQGLVEQPDVDLIVRIETDDAPAECQD